MKLSAKGRYAVIALADLASIKSDRPITLAEIAERQEISLSYLEQLFAKLRRHGVVKGVRGPGGGYSLARPASQTSIADIILAVDENIETTACKNDTKLNCKGKTGKCLAHDLWNELGQHIYLFLNSITLDDVLQRRVIGTAGGARLQSLELASS
ncbi:MAG: Rrf2 family transcriptional regulator [Robiginitomaculum sp.]|nr:MAG: Rrf2 family transcriptional regulator [Robiginitomaculum sp.]